MRLTRVRETCAIVSVAGNEMLSKHDNEVRGACGMANGALLIIFPLLMLPSKFHFSSAPLAIYWGKGGWLCPMPLSSYTTVTSSKLQLKTETIFLHLASFSLPQLDVYQAVVVSKYVKTEKGYPRTCSLCERNAYVTIRNQYPICYSIYGGALCASSRWYILDVKWCKSCLLWEDEAREVRRP